MQTFRRITILSLALAVLAGCNTGSREDPNKASTSGGSTTTPTLPGGGITTGPLAANLLVDTNRDGTIATDDEADEDTWSTTKGAAFVANNDDDDGDGTRDGTDSVMNGATDRDDMSPIRILQATGVTGNHTVEITFDPPVARGRIRLFDAAGNVLFAPNATTPAIIPNADVAAGDVDVYLEAVTTRSTQWDGSLEVVLTIKDQGSPISQDRVAMRLSPVIFVDNTQKCERVYVMEITNPSAAPNPGLYGPLNTQRPAGVDLFTVDGPTYGYDRWVQDSMQQGYMARPGQGSATIRRSNLQCARTQGGLLDLIPDELLKADYGYDEPGGQITSHNYGGNFEVTPPYTNGADNYPLGRLLTGGGSAGTVTGTAITDGMNTQQTAWLDAQEVQGPSKELSSEWLAVGHIDEVFIFIPDGQGDWRLLIGTPDRARQVLQTVPASTTVFAGRQSQTTAGGILNDSNLMAFNNAVQARIDSMEAELVALMGIPQSKIHYLPVLYEQVSSQGHAIALNPGVQNMVVVNSPSGQTTLFIPDPEGPNDSTGTDVWQTEILKAAQQGTGHTVEFVDVFESYHELMGEAHCGTNTERSPYSTQWWN